MTIKDILVHIDTSLSCGVRLELAAALARRFNAFLLMAMGAYGHSHLREPILGGMTRDILRQMTVPVLMAH
jgi:nucleotide-binding universal stress UspA family protein